MNNWPIWTFMTLFCIQNSNNILAANSVITIHLDYYLFLLLLSNVRPEHCISANIKEGYPVYRIIIILIINTA